MSTNITIDVVLQRLKQLSDQVTGQNRAERQEREEALLQPGPSTRTQRQSQTVLLASSGRTSESAGEQVRARSAAEHSGVPDLYKKRRPAAQRDQQTLVPFALNWRGNLTPRTPTVYEFQTRATSGVNPVPPSYMTYSGGDYLAASNFEISTAKEILQIQQRERYSEWKTTAKIAWLSFYGPQWSYEGFWAEELRSSQFGDALTWELPSAPGNVSPVGPLSHSTTGSYLAVGTDGTMFIMVALPYEAIDTNTVQTPSTSPPITTFYRDVYYSTVNEPFKLAGLQQYVTVNGSNAYNGLPLGSFANYPSKPLHTFAGQPYLFMKVKNGQITSKTATKTSTQNLADFYAANAWEDDPGRQMRGTYIGEVRIKGNQAHILRMRYEELFEGDTYIWYEDFPFGSLSSFVTGTGANATLQAGVTFEDHIYNLSPYSTPAELATQLSNIIKPGGYNGEISDPPDQTKPVSVPSAFFASAAKQLSTSGSDELTPLTYFVAMP